MVLHQRKNRLTDTASEKEKLLKQPYSESGDSPQLAKKPEAEDPDDKGSVHDYTHEQAEALLIPSHGCPALSTDSQRNQVLLQKLLADAGLKSEDMPVLEAPETQSWLAQWWTDSDWTIGAMINFYSWVISLPKFNIGAQRIAGGSPVFRFCPGVRAIGCVDYVSTGYVLGAPTSILDRETGTRTGAMGFDARLLGANPPALVLNQFTDHRAVRAMDVAMFMSRKDHVQPAFERGLDTSFESSSRIVNGPDCKKYSIYEVTCGIVSECMFQWMFDVNAPNAKDIMKYGMGVVSKARTNSWMSNIGGDIMYAILHHGIDDVILRGRNLINSSPTFDQLLQIAEEHGITTEDLDLHLLFTMNFNSTFAFGFILACCLGAFEANPDALEALREELGTTYPTLENVDSFPLLESVMLEVHRLFMLPSFMFREAQQDFDLPSSDGNFYRVKKGEIIQANFSMGLRDPRMFENPNDFDAWRFIKNPELKTKVWPFGFIDGCYKTRKDHVMGCGVYATHFGNKQNKLILAHVVQRVYWRLSHKPILDGEFMSRVGPKNIHINHWSTREIVYDS